MTGREALGLLRIHRRTLEDGGCVNGRDSVEEFNTAIAAMEKQVEQGVLREQGGWKHKGGIPIIRYDACPVCRNDIEGYKPRYCQYCGQKLDWSDYWNE